MASIAKAARKLSGRLAPERSHNVVLRIVTPPQPFPKYKGTMATRGTVSFVGSRVKNCRSLPEWDILTPAVEYHLQVVEYQSQAVESQLGPLSPFEDSRPRPLRQPPSIASYLHPFEREGLSDLPRSNRRLAGEGALHECRSSLSWRGHRWHAHRQGPGRITLAGMPSDFVSSRGITGDVPGDQFTRGISKRLSRSSLAKP